MSPKSVIQLGKNSVAPHCRTKIQGAGLDPHLGVEMVGLGIRGWRRVGLGICKVGGSRSNLAPWILCSAVRTISKSYNIRDTDIDYFWQTNGILKDSFSETLCCCC